LLSACCVGWIVYRFIESGLLQRVARSSQAEPIAGHVAAAIPLYAIGVLSLAAAWWFLQASVSRLRPGFRDTVLCYAITQFGKYLPGSVAQYVGRHVMLKRWGMSHAALVFCAMAEAGLLVAAALLWGASLIDQIVPALSWIGVLCAVPLVVLASGWIFAIAQRRAPRWMGQMAPLAPAWLIPAMLLYLLFFALMAATLMLVAVPFDAVQGGYGLLAAVAALSWAAGYLVIGAPAGLGVREAVFIVLLKGHLPEEEVLLLVAGFRMATFGGDLLAFLIGLPFMARLRKTVDADAPGP
jgi:hypothetical protein